MLNKKWIDNDFNWFICLGSGIVENTEPVVPSVTVTEEQGKYHLTMHLFIQENKILNFWY